MFLLPQAFPLNQEAADIKVKDNVQLPSKFRIKSEMMLEMEKIEPQIFHMEKPTDEEKDDEEPKLTREELIQRSRELRQLRIKESQRSAKAHHQNKIKSKKYHRILKKEKMKAQIKEFELLQKTDPEAALRKIEQLDKSRIEERAMLRHRNTGTWAKNLQVRAKYDKEARKDLADQIAISREMTAKKKVEDSDDEDDEAAGLGGDTEADPFNPWIKVGNTNDSGNGNDVGEFLTGYRKYWQERNEKEKELADYKSVKNVESIQSDEDELAEKPVSNKNSKKVKKSTSNSKPGMKSKQNNGWLEEDMSDVPSTKLKKKKKVDEQEKKEKLGKKLKKEKKEKKKAPIVENIDDLFDDAEDVMRMKYIKKYEKLQSQLASNKNTKKSKKEESDEDEVADESQPMDLRFKKQNKRPELDEALNGDDADDGNPLSKQITKTLNAITSNGHSGSQSANGTATNFDSENINPNDIAKVKPQHLSTALPDTIYSVADDGFNEYDDDYHFDEEKKMTIAEAFEDDDVVAEFKTEKDEEEKKNGPQEIDMSMPGWGSWGGSGIDPTKQKTKRKLVLRKHENPNVHLKIKRNLICIDLLQVSQRQKNVALTIKAI